MHAIVARLRIRPENRAEFLEASQAIIAGTRAEAGCLFYALHEDAHDPCSFLFYEEWQDRAAIDAHFAEPHFAAFGAAIEPWVVEKSLVIHEVASSEHP
ncbi:MAG: antibiotic biosynthesis monooxygenase [Planctomycetes bacterium]|nr:antibiotic biosynthesis monooxygenase [Planctomycetota bacterium]